MAAYVRGGNTFGAHATDRRRYRAGFGNNVAYNHGGGQGSNGGARGFSPGSNVHVQQPAGGGYNNGYRSVRSSWVRGQRHVCAAAGYRGFNGAGRTQGQSAYQGGSNVLPHAAAAGRWLRQWLPWQPRSGLSSSNASRPRHSNSVQRPRRRSSATRPPHSRATPRLRAVADRTVVAAAAAVVVPTVVAAADTAKHPDTPQQSPRTKNPGLCCCATRSPKPHEVVAARD